MRRFLEGNRLLPSLSDVKQGRRIAGDLKAVLASLERGVRLAETGHAVALEVVEANRRQLEHAVERLNALVREGEHLPPLPRRLGPKASDADGLPAPGAPPVAKGSSPSPGARGCAEPRNSASPSENGTGHSHGEGRS